MVRALRAVLIASKEKLRIGGWRRTIERCIGANEM